MLGFDKQAREGTSGSVTSGGDAEQSGGAGNGRCGGQAVEDCLLSRGGARVDTVSGLWSSLGYLK